MPSLRLPRSLTPSEGPSTACLARCTALAGLRYFSRELVDEFVTFLEPYLGALMAEHLTLLPRYARLTDGPGLEQSRCVGLTLLAVHVIEVLS